MKFKKYESLLFIIISLITIYEIFKPKSYTVEYTINNYQIIEEYNHNTKNYLFTINQSYTFLYPSQYHYQHKLITNIETFSEEDTTCLKPTIKKTPLNPLCLNNNEAISYELVSSNLLASMAITLDNPKKIATTNNIDIYNQENNYLIWNYQEFISIKNNNYKKLKLFNKDIYNISLATMINNYLLIPNYDQEYNFNEFYIINLKTLKVDKWQIKYDISYDSYILGSFDKSVYLVDNKNKVEYEIVPHRKKMRIIGTSNKSGKIINNNTFESISLTKLTTSKEQFTYNYPQQFIINNKYLYSIINDNYTKLTTNEVKYIVKQTPTTIYYLTNNKLYSYNYETGTKLLLEYFEWNFNYENHIFIY